MMKVGCMILGLASTILISTGCDDKRANTNRDLTGTAITNVEKEVELRGKFKRSFEIYELESQGSTYYVSDPNNLLIRESKGVNQQSYYKLFETCIAGNISPEGQYGPLGKYQKQITVRAICA